MKKILLISLTVFCFNLGFTQNLVTNGDFSSGNTGFTTGYTSDCGNAPLGETKYCVNTNPNIQHGAWSACGDHTTGTGNMMILNGTSTAGVNVWSQTVTVLPNTCYNFSTWATSIYSGNPAKIRLTINADSQPYTQLSANTCTWQQVSTVWNSGASTTAILTIWDDDLNPGGNDFAIDDISFVQTACLVPLNWLSIEASYKANNSAVIEWATSNETNIANFIIEKSTDGVKYYSIGTVSPAGQYRNNYQFTDSAINANTNYYRIKEINFSNQFTYSTIVKVDAKNKMSLALRISPNPVFEKLNLNFSGIKGGVYTVAIYNVNGSNVFGSTIKMLNANFEKTISVNSKWPAGMYFAIIQNTSTKEMAKQSFMVY